MNCGKNCSLCVSVQVKEHSNSLNSNVSNCIMHSALKFSKKKMQFQKVSVFLPVFCLNSFKMFSNGMVPKEQRKFFKKPFVSTFSLYYYFLVFRALCYVQQCNMMSHIKLKNWPKEIRNFCQFILLNRLAKYKLCIICTLHTYA